MWATRKLGSSPMNFFDTFNATFRTRLTIARSVKIYYEDLSTYDSLLYVKPLYSVILFKTMGNFLF